jgi:hypothetical protein
VAARSRGGTFRSNVATLGWNNTPTGKDTTTPRAPARVSISVPDSLRRAWGVGRSSAVLVTIGSTDQKPGPRRVARDSSARRDSAAKAPARPRPPATPKGTPPKDTTPPDFSVEMEDGAGRVVKLPLSDFGAVRLPLESYIYRRKGRDKTQFPTLAEPVMQTYVLPLEAFARANTSFDPASIRTVRLVFDRVRAGTIMLDDVGITTVPAAK